MSNLELLANELFLSLFEYLNDVHLIRAFYGLNNRLNKLLASHLRWFRFDFRSIYREDFNFICQEYFPSIIDRIISLHLTDNDDTPEQLNLFLSFIPSCEQFTQLQSLSLSNLRNTFIVNQILISLDNLTNLNLSACILNTNLNYNRLLIDTIWNLPKLISCQLDQMLPFEVFLLAPTIQSLSLRYLTIDDYNRSLAEFLRLCEYTPNLQYLQISIWEIEYSDTIQFQFQYLSRLKLSFQGSFEVLTSLFQITPNLECLIFRTQRILLNGYQWEQLIEDYLPKLKRLEFLMQYSIPYENYDELIESLFQSFQTEFWLNKHQWFIEYHSNENRWISLYTYPYYFNDFIYENIIQQSSICSVRMYDRVHHLWYGIGKKISIYSSAKFQNIRYRYLDLPFNEHFWSIIPNMNQLISLNIERYNNGTAYSQLQFLLDRSPNLYSLTFTSPYFSPKLFFQLKCSTIRQLNLVECDHYFNKQQCLALINSPFVHQCEILRIKIKKRSDILQLINKIKSLRTLIFQCQETQLIDWLSQHLPSTYFISEDLKYSIIRIWIR
jgi:hypothetical protein